MKLVALLALLLASTGARAEEGIASTHSGGAVACPGERFAPRALVAAHRTLPCGSLAKVTALANGRWTIVRIVDRGPFRRGRVVDLSPRAAAEIGSDGLARVRVVPYRVRFGSARKRPGSPAGAFSGFEGMWVSRIGL